jgi:hypothetical protein
MVLLIVLYPLDSGQVHSVTDFLKKYLIKKYVTQTVTDQSSFLSYQKMSNLNA